MIINSISIQNIKSIGEKIKISFNKKGTNILIGPNGGGKSNLMDILNISLNTFFIWHWNEHKEPFKTLFLRKELNNFFDLSRHDNIKDDVNQELEIELEFSENDLQNIKIIKNNLDKISEIEGELSGNGSNEIYTTFNDLFSRVDVNLLKNEVKQVFSFSQHLLNVKTADDCYNSFSDNKKLFFRYLNYFEKIKYLIEKHNEKFRNTNQISELKYNWKFFSPNRFHEGQSFEISLPGQNKTDKIRQSKEKTSNKTSSDVDYFTYYFSKLSNDLKTENQLLTEKGKPVKKKFSDIGQVKRVKELLHLVGNYDFKVEVTNADDNKFKFIIETDGRQVEFNKLSSGEKEIFNFIFSIEAFDLKDAVLIIDEPEIHLHPRWQSKLIRLYDEVSNIRNLQFVVVTHSPFFVSSETIQNITRIYKSNGFTKLIPENRNSGWNNSLGEQKDLIDIITYSNSAKLFFADNIILVEGMTDEIIFGYLLDKFNKGDKSIEVVSVNGKNNFLKYIEFLDKFKINSFVIADLDNIWEGSLLKGVTLLNPIKDNITKLTKNNSLELLEPYFKSKSIKRKLTQKDVGLRILKIIYGLQKNNKIIEKDEKFLKFWINNSLDNKKILDEIDFMKEYKKFNLNNLEDVLSELKKGVEIKKINCPIFILEAGSLEVYCGNVSHDKEGALNFLKKIRDYLEDENKKKKKDEFEYLITLVKEIINYEITI